MKKIFSKFTKILLLIAMVIYDLMTPIKVFAETINTPKANTPVNSVTMVFNNGENVTSNREKDENGNIILQDGDLLVTKSAEAIDAENGKYRIKFDIIGKGVPTTKPIYSVVVFDRSDSMHGTQVNGHYVKWENAKSAALTYVDTLGNGTNQFGLIAYNSSVTVQDYAHVGKYKFSPEKYTDTYLGISPSGGTVTYKALQEAEKYLNNVPEGTKPIIVIISDGAAQDFRDVHPKLDENGNTYCENNLFCVQYADNSMTNDDITEDYPLVESNFLKRLKTKATIFTIGYDLDSLSDQERPRAKNMLSKLPSTNGKYISADVDTLVSEINKLATSISNNAEGAQLIEVPNNAAFTFTGNNNGTNGTKALKVTDIDNDTHTITYESISYDIEIADESLPTDVYPTNDTSATKIFINNEDGTQTVIANITETPSVLWERQNYIINYYKDEITDANYLGSSERIKALDGTTVTLTEEQKNAYLNNAGRGYELASTNKYTITIDKNIDNVINILYTKKDYNYTVNYYHDEISEDNFINKVTGTGNYNQKIEVNEELYLTEDLIGYEYTFGDKDFNISDEGDNIVNIVYTKKDYNYIIKYYLDNTNGEPIHTDTGTGNYNDHITVTEDKYLSEHIGYEYTGEDKDFDIVDGENVITIIYTKKDYNYTINYYLDDANGNPAHTDTGTGNYNDHITVTEDKYLSEHIGYEYTGEDKDFDIVDGENVITIIYTKKDYSYTINYYHDEINEDNFINKVEGSGNYNDHITVDEGKYLTEDLVGYEYAGEDRDFNISVDEENNIINIIYTKALYNYQINYYFDSISEENKVATISDYANYNVTIEVDELLHVNDKIGYEYTGIDRDFVVSINPENNIIDIVYTKKDYNYTINYYLDDANGNPAHTDTGTGNYNDHITVTEDKYLSEHIGYEYTGEDKDFDIVDGENVITIVYTKKDYNYTINYYHDAISEDNFINKVTGTGNYNDPVTVDEEKFLTGLTGYEYVGENQDFNISVIEANNVINIVYTKANFMLTVNYFFNGTPNNSLKKEVSIQYGTKVYASTYNLTTNEIEEHNLNGYKLHPTTPYKPTYVVIDTENKVINIYYVSPASQDNDTITKEATNNTITSTDDTVTYTINYSTTLKNVIGEVTVTIVDKLPLGIDLEKSSIGDGEYNDKDHTITWTRTYTFDEFKESYDLTIDEIEYTVKYNDIDAEYSYTKDVYTNKANASVSVNYNNDDENLGDTETTEDVKVEIYGNLTVEYITYDENNRKINLTDSISNEELVGTPYETKGKDFYGYKLIDTIGNTTGKYTEEGINVTYVYEKNAGNIDDELTKTGPKDISGIDTPIEYSITYEATITDYIGEAKVTITDNLPYAINTNSSELDGGTYNTDNNTITWVETFNIDEEHTEIIIEKNISIIYLNLNTENITNTANSLIQLDKNKENNTDETITKLNKGKVVVHYLEKDTNINLAEDVILEDFVGKNYTTEEKTIDEYFVSEIVGETKGTFTDDTIVVTYIYEKLGKGTDILPPQTGMNINSNNPYIFYILSSIVLFILTIFRKKENI